MMRGRTSAFVSILASSATRCRFVDRFVRLNVLSRVSRQRSSPHGTPASRTLRIATKGFRSQSRPPFLDLSWRKGSFIVEPPFGLSIRSPRRRGRAACLEFLEAERLGSFQVKHQFELGRLYDRPAQNGTSPRLDVKGHAAARPQRDACDWVRPMPDNRSETKGVN